LTWRAPRKRFVKWGGGGELFEATPFKAFCKQNLDPSQNSLVCLNTYNKKRQSKRGRCKRKGRELGGKTLATGSLLYSILTPTPHYTSTQQGQTRRKVRKKRGSLKEKTGLGHFIRGRLTAQYFRNSKRVRSRAPNLNSGTKKEQFGGKARPH